MNAAFKVIAEETIRKAERVPGSSRDLIFGLQLILDEVQERLNRETWNFPEIFSGDPLY